MKDASKFELNDEMMETVAGGIATPSTWSGQCPNCKGVYYICSGTAPKPAEGPVCKSCLDRSIGVFRCNVIPLYLD